MAMFYATGHISGAHINPAVTIAMLATKNIEAKKAAGYIVSQLFGAAVAGFMLTIFFVHPQPNLHMGVPDLAAGISVGRGILIEAVLTFLLVFTIFGSAVDKKAQHGFHGLAIGI